MNNKPLFKKYTARAKTLLPIHVGGGAGQAIDPLEYVVTPDGWFYRIDLDAMINTDRVFAEEFIKLRERSRGLIELRELIRKAFKPESCIQWTHRAKASVPFANYYRERFSDSNNQLVVQCMPAAGKNAYIPGSSIKGALRTAILDKLARDKNYQSVLEKTSLENKPPVSGKVESFLLTGSFFMKPDTDPLKNIKISDAIIPEDATDIAIVKNRYADKDTGVDMVVETGRRGIEFSFEINLPTLLTFDTVKSQRPEFLNLDWIREALWDYTVGEPGNVITEMENHYTGGRNKTAEENIEAIIEEAERTADKGDIAFLRLGRFSHLECMTYSDRPANALDRKPHLAQISERTHPKGWGVTRNLVDGKIPLGVLRLEFVEK